MFHWFAVLSPGMARVVYEPLQAKISHMILGGTPKVDRIHKWRSRNYSFVLMLIILTTILDKIVEKLCLYDKEALFL